MTKKPQLSQTAILAELQRRSQQVAEVANAFDFSKYTFYAQQQFLRGSNSRFKCAVTSRRAGKSSAIAADMLDTCSKEPHAQCLYLTLTRESARNIIWGILLQLVDDYSIPCTADHTRLHLKFTNGAKIMLGGAKDAVEIEKYRGLKLRKCYIDECQSFKYHIRTLIDDIIVPALRDLRGSLYLTGTPGPVPAGAFYEYSHSDFWDNHAWTAFDNPHMHNPEAGKDLNVTLAEERQMKGIDESNPSYQRETYGRWIEDKDALVFKFDKTRNVYTELPKTPMRYVFGIDLGYDDADAIAVLGYDLQSKHVYLVEEVITRKQNITSLVEQIRTLQSKYNANKMVIDAGALGKKIVEEIRTRHHIHLEAADKHRKLEYIELLNDDLRTGKFKAFKDSVFAEDCFMVQWDRDAELRNPESRKVSTVFHSDICDSVLYAWRECKHFMSEAAVEVPSPHDPNYLDYQEALEAEKLERLMNGDDWDQIAGVDDLDDFFG